MAALAADTTVRSRSRSVSAFAVADAKTLYATALACLCTARNATAGDIGYVRPFTGAKGELPLGQKYGPSVLGDIDGSPVPEAEINLEADDKIQLSTPVTGLAGTYADVAQLVYASNDNTYTLTRPTRGLAVGIVIAPEDATVCTVLWFDAETIIAISLAGAGRYLMNLGSVDCDTLTTANVRTAIPLPHGGRFIDFFAMVDVAITGAGGTATLNLEIDGTDVTGGVITVSTAAGGTKGAKLAGTAISALNTFAEGSTLDIEAVLGTDMTAGRVDLFATVAPSAGL